MLRRTIRAARAWAKSRRLYPTGKHGHIVGAVNPGRGWSETIAGADAYLIDPTVLAVDWSGPMPALACIDLDRCGNVPVVRLPPFPVIGLGDPSHPLADMLDAAVAPPVGLGRIVAQAERYPNAAAATVQLLRSIDGLTADRGLVAESMCYAMLQGSLEHREWLATRRGGGWPPGRIRVRRDGALLRITIDRPEARGAIDRVMRDALYEAFTLAAMDASIERIELGATGAVFGVGADLAEFGTTRDPATAHAIRTATLPAYPLSRCASRVSSHIHGACIGASLELAAFSGRITATPSAWFQLPELAMGILPGSGGCVSVPRRIGRQRAALMMLSGRRIDAATALRWGLIDAIVDAPPGDPGAAYDD